MNLMYQLVFLCSVYPDYLKDEAAVEGCPELNTLAKNACLS